MATRTRQPRGPANKRSELPDHKEIQQTFRERIGSKEFVLVEDRLDVDTEITLWAHNPRIQPFLSSEGFASEEDLQEALRRTSGYDGLLKSIEQVGQMDPIYVWKSADMKRYLVLEGATRVTILRELLAKKNGKPDADRFRYAKVKILPEGFTERERAILLARIHVRGSAVRSWGRYVEAKFIHESVTPQHGHKPLMTLSDLAQEMEKSVAWVSRLKDAYEFGQQFVEYVDTTDAESQAAKYFSVLEEISKASNFGARVRNPQDEEWTKVRNEVFDMVSNDVFQEYRDARFMQKFYEDPEKWEQLKSHQKDIAHRLAAELKTGETNLKGKVNGLYGAIERGLKRDATSLDDDDLAQLRQAADLLDSHLHGTNVFRHRVLEFIEVLENASLHDVKKIHDDELSLLKSSIADIDARRSRQKPLRSA